MTYDVRFSCAQPETRYAVQFCIYGRASMKRIALPLLATSFVLALMAGAAAQSGPKPEASGARLITLGTRGGPLPTKDRAQSSNLLVVNGTLYLIDAGDGVTRRIVQSGHD